MKKTVEFTSKEKLKLVMGKNGWNNEDFGGKIYKFRVADASLGLRTPYDPDRDESEIRPSIAYPSSQMLSHTWNRELIYQMGVAIGNDCVEYGVDILLGPGINIKRLPTCGRNFEYYSEDPFLAGTIAKLYVEGLQSQHIGACVKHYCANNAEYARLYSSSEVDPRTLNEIYLRPFATAMRAKPWTVMCSYNLLNGTLMSENQEMFRVLREEMGFDGLIMSDWGAVRRTMRSIESGLDLEMGHYTPREIQFEEDYDNGLVNEEALSVAANRVIALAEKCESENACRKITLSPEEREAVAKEIEREAIVLLKNQNGALPLKNETLVLTGAPERRYYTGGGAARVTPTKPYLRLSRALAEMGFDASYRESVRDTVGGQSCMNGSAVSVREELKSRDAVIIEVGNPDTVELESRDRQTIRLSHEEEDIIRYLARSGKKTIVVVYAGAAIDMSAWIDEVDAVLWAGFGGQCTNEVVAEVLTGKINPSGKLTETFPLSLDDVKAMHSYHDPETFRYEEELEVGYRYFETENVPVLFPFGFGLSYSSFVYDHLSIVDKGDLFEISFDVTNTSDTDGKETAQLYVSRLAEEPGRPCRELKGFTKVAVAAHKTVRATIELPREELRYFSLKTGTWEACVGTLTLQIGKNCHDIALTGEITL